MHTNFMAFLSHFCPLPKLPVEWSKTQQVTQALKMAVVLINGKRQICDPLRD